MSQQVLTIDEMVAGPEPRPTIAEEATFSQEPVRYSLEEIVPAAGISLTAAWNVLQTRREVMERVCGIEEVAATKKRHEAQVEACAHRLKTEKLVAHDLKAIEGLLEECAARVRRCERQIEQYQMELQVLYQQLIG